MIRFVYFVLLTAAVPSLNPASVLARVQIKTYEKATTSKLTIADSLRINRSVKATRRPDTSAASELPAVEPAYQHGTATWFQYATAIVTLIFSAVTVWFIRRQHRLEKTKIKLELYPRRLEIYDSIQSFIAEVLQYATTDTERLLRMLRETRHADFLFDDNDITQYIRELHTQGAELEMRTKRLNSGMRYPSEEERRYEIDRVGQLIKWFQNQLTTTDKKFEKYLRLRDKLHAQAQNKNIQS